MSQFESCPLQWIFYTKEGLHHIIVLDIHSISPWSVWSQSFVKDEFDCRYQYQTYVDYWCKYSGHICRWKKYERHDPTSTTDIASWTLRHFSALNGVYPIIWHHVFQKLVSWDICKMNQIDDFCWKTFLFLTEQNPCQPAAFDDRKEESRKTTVCERGSLPDDVVPRLQDQESRSLQKGGPHWRARRLHARSFSTTIMTRKNFTVKGILDDVVIVKTHLTILVVTSGVYKSIPQCLICCEEHSDRRHWRHRSFISCFSCDV